MNKSIKSALVITVIVSGLLACIILFLGYNQVIISDKQYYTFVPCESLYIDNDIDAISVGRICNINRLTIDCADMSSIDFLKNVKGLKELNIYTDHNLNWDAISYCDSLETLRIFGSNIIIHDFEFISQLNHLKELNFGHGDTLFKGYNFYDSKIFSLSGIEDLSALEKLYIGNIKCSSVCFDKTLSNIKHITIYDSDFESLTVECDSIENLVLGECSFLKEIKVDNDCKMIDMINVRECNKIEKINDKQLYLSSYFYDQNQNGKTYHILLNDFQ